MKKMIFAGLVAFLALSFAACEMGQIGGKEDDTPSVTIIEDANGVPTQVTIRIDGHEGKTVVSGSARALSKPIAQEVYDNYEVAFKNSSTTVRASWKVGETVSISGVPRGPTAGTGINYNLTGGGVLSDSVGNAILFVGRLTGDGLTLLAIGKVIAVDGVTGTTVNPSSKSVTFGLSALTGDAKTSVTPGANALATPNDVTSLDLGGGILVNSYNFEPNKTCTATYELTSSSSVGIDLLLAGVLNASALVNPIPFHGTLGARIPTLNSKELTSIDYSANLTSNRTATFATTGIITMTFDTAASPLGTVALIFNIPVYAIDDTSSPKTWYLRPGLNLYEIDTSDSSINAGILISNGKPTITSDGLIIVTQ